MRIGDSFVLKVNKPKATKGKTYKVFKKIESLEDETEYWFYNDANKPQTLYSGEFCVSLQIKQQ